MKNILIAFTIMSFAFSQTFEIDGELSVTGSIESTTIDSLKEVIENESTTIDSLKEVIENLEDQLNNMQNLTDVHSFNQISLEIINNVDPNPHVFDPIPLIPGKPVKVYYRYSLGESDNHRNNMSVSFSNSFLSLEGEISGSSMNYSGSNWNIGGFTPEEEMDFIITVTAINEWDNPNNSATHSASATVLIIQ